LAWGRGVLSAGSMSRFCVVIVAVRWRCSLRRGAWRRVGSFVGGCLHGATQWLVAAGVATVGAAGRAGARRGVPCSRAWVRCLVVWWWEVTVSAWVVGGRGGGVHRCRVCRGHRAWRLGCMLAAGHRRRGVLGRAVLWHRCHSPSCGRCCGWGVAIAASSSYGGGGCAGVAPVPSGPSCCVRTVGVGWGAVAWSGPGWLVIGAGLGSRSRVTCGVAPVPASSLRVSARFSSGAACQVSGRLSGAVEVGGGVGGGGGGSGGAAVALPVACGCKCASATVGRGLLWKGCWRCRGLRGTGCGRLVGRPSLFSRRKSRSACLASRPLRRLLGCGLSWVSGGVAVRRARASALSVGQHGCLAGRTLRRTATLLRHITTRE